MYEEGAADGDGGMAHAADWRGGSAAVRDGDAAPPAVVQRQRVGVRAALLPETAPCIHSRRCEGAARIAALLTVVRAVGCLHCVGSGGT